MNSLSRVWRVGAFGLVVALFAAACADDNGAAVGGPAPIVTGSISGTVTVSGTGAPVVGALVGTTPATSTALTDASGNYRIENIPIPASGSASFAVTASKDGLTTGANGTRTTTLTTAAPNATGINLQLDPPPPGPTPPTTGNLNVLVTNSAGVPQSGASVVATRQGGTALPAVTTDANGFAIFTGIAGGAYTVTATKTISGVPFKASGGVNVVNGETAFLQLTLGRDFGQTVFPNFRGAATTPTDIDFIPVAGAKDTNPDIDCNVIRTQHMFIVQVTNAANQPVSGVKVQWGLNISENGTVSLRCPELTDDPAGCTLPTVPGNTGSIVDSDDPDLDPFRARTGLNPSFIMDTRTAITFTNDQNGPNNNIVFGAQTVAVGEGQSWIVITSPQEGVTDVIASSSDIRPLDLACGLSNNPATECDKDFAVKRWVNWNIGVAELTGFDTPGPTRDPFDHPNTDCSSDGSGGWDCDGEISNGSTVLNVLSRGFDADCGPNPTPGTICELEGDEHDFISIVGRARPDGGFNISRGTMRWTITDDSPDVDFWGEGASNGLSTAADRDGCDETGSPNTPPWETCNAEHNGPSDDQYWVVGTATGNPQTPGSPTNNRNRAFIEFDANNNIFDGGVITQNPNCANPCDEDDFVGWGVVQTRLDPTVYFCTDADGDGDCNPAEPGGDTFSPAYAALIAGGDNTVTFEILFLDEFGEICAVFRFNKRYVTSRLQIVKQVSAPRQHTIGDPDGVLNGVDRTVKYHTIQRGETFSYTVTVTNTGEVNTQHVRITDTLPRFGRQFEGPPDDGLGVRDGHQAFQYLTDRAAFDPQAIVYGVDWDDDEVSDTIDECIIGRQAGNANAAVYLVPEICLFRGFGVVNNEAGSVEQARALAISRSTSATCATPSPGGCGVAATRDQIVFIQYYDEQILGRNPQGGGTENEDSIEITLAASSFVKYGPTGAGQSGFSSIPGNWCNIATVTDGPLNRGHDPQPTPPHGPAPGTASGPGGFAVAQSFDADTLCHRVVEAFLDIRKTAFDAVVPAGSVDSFRVEISNSGSTNLTNVTIVDSMDVNFPSGQRARQRLTSADIHLNATNFPGITVSAVDTTTSPAFDIFTVTIPTLTPGGFREAYRVVFRTLANNGTFCNRVIARATTPGGTFSETDIACVTVLPGAVEFDISNEDGTTPTPPPAGFTSAREIFRVGDGGAARPDSLVYQVIVRNQSTTFTATNVVIRDSVAPNSGIIACRAIVASVKPAVSGAAPTTCTLGDRGWVWNVGSLPPSSQVEIYFRAEALAAGDDVNRVRLTADQLVFPAVDNEPTSVIP